MKQLNFTKILREDVYQTILPSLGKQNDEANSSNFSSKRLNLSSNLLFVKVIARHGSARLYAINHGGIFAYNRGRSRIRSSNRLFLSRAKNQPRVNHSMRTPNEIHKERARPRAILVLRSFKATIYRVSARHQRLWYFSLYFSEKYNQ